MNGWIYLKSWGKNFLCASLVFAIYFFWVVYSLPYLLAAFFFVNLFASYFVVNDLTKTLQKKCLEAECVRDQALADTKVWKQSLLERSSGFPSLQQAIDHYESIKDEKVEQFLRYKKHPSKKGAEVVKEETMKRRKAEMNNRKTQAIIEYYESIAPFLVDLKDDVLESGDEVERYSDFTTEEKSDLSTSYLTKEEFRKLPAVEKNQLALDRFWSRPKSKALIGKLYERYVGYLFESKGYNIEYVGIFKGFEDLGRDLICRKGDDVVIVQCKNWSKFRTIYEKHIFQFFGTVFQYRDEHPKEKVKAIFYTTTSLSDLARRFSKALNIELVENHKFDQDYPSIKCNISKSSKEKIYHLPFDQQYDKVRIEIGRGEFYCATTSEAENAGFRRAFRHKSSKNAV